MIELVPHVVGQNLSIVDCHCPGKCFLLCFCISVKVVLMDENGKVGFTCNSRTSLLEHGVRQTLLFLLVEFYHYLLRKEKRWGMPSFLFHM